MRHLSDWSTLPRTSRFCVCKVVSLIHHGIDGLVDRRPALLVLDPNDPAAPPAYFVLLEWAHDNIAKIRDFRYARYVTESAEMIVVRSSMSTCRSLPTRLVAWRCRDTEECA